MSDNANPNSTNILNFVDLLGMTAKDKVTGFQGVISSLSFDLYGCVQGALSPPIDKEGKIIDGRWFDVIRFEILNDVPRVLPIPMFGATPETHVHGPAEKPEGGVK